MASDLRVAAVGLVLRTQRAALLALCLFSPTCTHAQPLTLAAEMPPASNERLLLLVEVPVVLIHERPDVNALVIGRLEQGTEVEGELVLETASGARVYPLRPSRDDIAPEIPVHTGDWYRIRRASGDEGWIFNGLRDTGPSLAVRRRTPQRRVDFDAADPDPRVTQSLSQAALAERADASRDPGIERRRPQGITLEPRLPLIDPSRVLPPSPLYRSEEVPTPDRWRLVKSLGILPYKPLDPYNPNPIKGDLPVLQKELGEGWFFNLTAVSDTLVEARRLPTPVGAQSTIDAGSNGALGRGRQTTVAETGIVSLSLINGNTTFKPPEYEFRFVPVFNVNRTVAEEVRAVNIDPRKGTTRNDGFVGVQELFVDKHLRDVSPRYDFDSIRVGIQPFTADFRGFLFLDQPFGVRLFGTRDNNRVQYNAAWFRRLEKDTNSGLNDVARLWRADDIFVFNVYWQDHLIPGYTEQATVLYNRNREGDRPLYNANGFLERPAVFGSGRSVNYDALYLGYSGDGHFGPWNVSASAYFAAGRVDRGQFSGGSESIAAFFGAVEVSRDFDWIRLRASALYASGDKDPYDDRAHGFDAVLENPQFAGADTSYWIRQAVPLIGGGGVALSIRNGVLPSLRSSREFGQSNFTNPGLRLLGFGADFDLAPGLRVISNVNYLEFDNVSSLAALRNQSFHSNRIGVDASVGVQYRPYFTQNVVLNASVAALFPGKGLRELYGNAVDSRQYSLLVNLLVTF